MGAFTEEKRQTKQIELHSSRRLSTKEMISIGLHFAISIAMFTCLIASLAAFYTSAGYQDLYENEYIWTAIRFLPFYYSLWGTTSQFICFNLFTIADIISLRYWRDKRSMKLANRLQYLASYILYSHTFPMSLAIFVIFWSWYIIDRESIYPVILDRVIPPWSNHAMHTCPLPITVVLLLTTDRYIPERKTALKSLLRTMSVYASAFGVMKVINGTWPYVGFHSLPFFVPYIVMSCVWLFTLTSLFVGYWLKATFKSLIKKQSEQKPLVENLKED